jgi:hypothetical protein
VPLFEQSSNQRQAQKIQSWLRLAFEIDLKHWSDWLRLARLP